MWTGGFGVFAGRDFRKGAVVIRSWKTLALPKTWPDNSVLWYYFFGHNETHLSLSLSYGSLTNNHESANIQYFQYFSTEAAATKSGFVVRDDFQRGNRNVLNIRMYCIHIYMQ